jgi:putative restriction endonuclease
MGRVQRRLGKLSFESEKLLAQLTGRIEELSDETKVFPEGKTRQAVIRTRVNQGFFRAAVLAAYGSSCCITGCSVTELLNASHIVPWSVDVKNRTNPRNGLCLNAIHDRAFDCGLLTVTPDLRVKISRKAKKKSSDVGTRELLLRYDDASISLPRHFAPEPEFLKYHNEYVFLES